MFQVSLNPEVESCCQDLMFSYLSAMRLYIALLSDSVCHKMATRNSRSISSSSPLESGKINNYIGQNAFKVTGICSDSWFCEILLKSYLEYQNVGTVWRI